MKQKTLLQRDLSKFEKDLATSPISLQGSISATLISFEKTIDQYTDQLKKYKLNNPADNEKAQTKYQCRLESLRQDYEDGKDKFQELKKKFNEVNTRDQLLKSSSNPFEEETVMNKRNIGNQVNDNLGNNRNNSSELPMYQGLRKEHSIFERGNAQLDYILEMGQRSLEDVMEQNAVLQKMQNQMTKSLQTLGVSNGTIEKINKRVFKDKLIFWAALALMFMGFFFLLKWLR